MVYYRKIAKIILYEVRSNRNFSNVRFRLLFFRQMKCTGMFLYFSGISYCSRACPPAKYSATEAGKRDEHTKFCGYSLYQPQPPRNAKLAPKRFVDGAKGLFKEHTEEEKKHLMEEHCSQISTDKVVAYCHYCIRGLNLGGKQGIHLARLLFEPESV